MNAPLRDPIDVLAKTELDRVDDNIDKAVVNMHAKVMTDFPRNVPNALMIDRLVLDACRARINAVQSFKRRTIDREIDGVTVNAPRIAPQRSAPLAPISAINAALEKAYDWPLSKGLKFGDATRNEAMAEGKRRMRVGGSYIASGKYIFEAGKLCPKGKTIREAHTPDGLALIRRNAGVTARDLAVALT